VYGDGVAASGPEVCRRSARQNRCKFACVVVVASGHGKRSLAGLVDSNRADPIVTPVANKGQHFSLGTKPFFSLCSSYVQGSVGPVRQ
jgi:hypothetical protein